MEKRLRNIGEDWEFCKVFEQELFGPLSQSYIDMGKSYAEVYQSLNNSNMDVSSISHKEVTANITPMSYFNGS